MAEQILQINHLSKSFGSNLVLKDIDFTVSTGDVISIRGRGKAAVTDAGARHSRKGRMFVRAEIAK